MRHWVSSMAIAALAAVASSVAASPSLGVGVVKAEFVANEQRRLPAVVWYPSTGPSDGVAYLDRDAAAVRVPAIARNFRYPVEDLHALTTVRLPVRPGAKPARRAQGFPVVVFSHGFFLYPEQNSFLATHLASHGYIVVSIAHPGDAADVRLEDGTVVATKLTGLGDDPRFSSAMKSLVAGADIASSREALPLYAESFRATRLGRSFAEWRDDTLAVSKAIVEGNEPRVLHDVLSAADRGRLAFAGMSFGGATSATTCKLVDACRAAVNLDGQNFDPDLFDRSVGRPFLLMLSDWTRYSLFEGQPVEQDFSPNDLAYEPWHDSGKTRDVVRVRLERIRHMGFTDLVSLLDGPKRNERVGEIPGDEALAAINDVVLAFLDVHVRDGDRADLDRAVDRHPSLKRHAPSRMKRWAGETE